MQLTAQQKTLCQQIVNVFETGAVLGRYGSLTRFHDGPHGLRQVTYGRSQTTEYGNLQDLCARYVDYQGTFSQELRPYVEKIGVHPLSEDETFCGLLRDAGNQDPLMRECQDVFFEERYFAPAMQWAEANGFTLPLSALVIYDSFIHSGSILRFLRQRFPERVPEQGGDEKSWVMQYVATRESWLATAPNPILHKTVYRTQCFQKEIERGNWDLSQLPIIAHGVAVVGLADAMSI